MNWKAFFITLFLLAGLAGAVYACVWVVEFVGWSIDAVAARFGQGWAGGLFAAYAALFVALVVGAAAESLP